jgi:hypothetical protein
LRLSAVWTAVKDTLSVHTRDVHRPDDAVGKSDTHGAFLAVRPQTAHHFIASHVAILRGIDPIAM